MPASPRRRWSSGGCWRRRSKTRHDLGREELVSRIWQWKDEYENRILGQLKQMGCSCDWAAHALHARRGLCPGRAADVLQAVQGRPDLPRQAAGELGHRSCRPPSPTTRSTTKTVKGGFWTFKYPVIERHERVRSRFSTTRPETMLGDTAVCVHPNDPRYKHLIGKHVTLPLVNRDIPIIADGLLADPELGTGCVKVTPAHDPNDYDVRPAATSCR